MRETRGLDRWAVEAASGASASASSAIDEELDNASWIAHMDSTVAQEKQVEQEAQQIIVLQPDSNDQQPPPPHELLICSLCEYASSSFWRYSYLIYV